ncbi:MAG: hypothetical protein HW388_174 [Dehalococcoidia bacterium]|nr:hypothetical protein [Dehalococcoidia bacterium]
MKSKRVSRIPLVPALLILFLVAVSATACGGGETPRDILSKSRNAMAQLQSYRFGGEIRESDEKGRRSFAQSGEWVGPDRFHLKVEGNGHVDELIVVGLQAYSYESDYPGRGWRKQLLPGMGVSILNSEYQEELINLGVVKEVVAIDGLPVFHLVGKLSRDEERAIQAARELLTKDDPFLQEKLVSIARWRTSVELFVSKSDYRILRMVHSVQMEGWETSIDALGIKTFRAIPRSQITVTSYSDFNAPVTIEAPK